MSTKSSGFPFRLYVYDESGKHSGPVEIINDLQLRIQFQSAVSPAVDAGREVVITDWEDFCVFHAKGGVVLYPTPVDIAANAEEAT